MSSFDPNKLTVTIIPPASSSFPVKGRKYTLTHSDETGDLFLDIGYVYNELKINSKMRDEVIAQWSLTSDSRWFLAGKAYVDGGEYSKEQARVRHTIFLREMDTALKGIVNGDLPFYLHYPFLLDAPIYLYFESQFPEFRKVYSFNTPRMYLVRRAFHK
ncbi:staygreen family protein [Metabacillus sp. HB246100]|uniref:staygreen family protein n=1 Tax=Bacillus weihaiensis TaxID=1547283 RepID=UPI0023570322|nr:staygreen family protein [Bacillus weihaiensis]